MGGSSATLRRRAPLLCFGSAPRLLRNEPARMWPRMPFSPDWIGAEFATLLGNLAAVAAAAGSRAAARGATAGGARARVFSRARDLFLGALASKSTWGSLGDSRLRAPRNSP